jgi:plasmid maintenance system antidote protein VapI
MAGMLDLDISSLSRIERGKQALTPAIAVKLEAMSNIDRADWLWPKEGKNGRNKDN